MIAHEIAHAVLGHEAGHFSVDEQLQREADADGLVHRWGFAVE